MRSSLFCLVIIGCLAAVSVNAGVGEKRTILTSGEKVHTIRYQLGQSTVLYFGLKPETVICGNKNYFHIDKIKEGITIQAGSNFSTNLTVLSQGRRYLFYLTPAGGAKPDPQSRGNRVGSERKPEPGTVAGRRRRRRKQARRRKHLHPYPACAAGVNRRRTS